MLVMIYFGQKKTKNGMVKNVIKKLNNVKK